PQHSTTHYEGGPQRQRRNRNKANALTMGHTTQTNHKINQNFWGDHNESNETQNKTYHKRTFESRFSLFTPPMVVHSQMLCLKVLTSSRDHL
ncbi:hypothetical protein VIGAN_UM125600, partial [Vigna angularis var. angularis]